VEFEKLKNLESPREVGERELREKNKIEQTEKNKKGQFFYNQMKSMPSVVEYFESNYLQKEYDITYEKLRAKVSVKLQEEIETINNKKDFDNK
jgi:hypothetical protein